MNGRPLLVLCAALAVSGCTLPQRISRTIHDKKIYDQEESEKSANDSCNQNALPGTLQHFACRMQAEQQAGKTNPPAN